MGDEAREYIDNRLKDLASTLKWSVGIMMLILISFVGISINNSMKIKDIEFDVVVLNARTEDLKYKMTWIIEINELVREYYKENTDEKSAIEFLEKAQKMEHRIMANEEAMPTLRSGYYKNKH